MHQKQKLLHEELSQAASNIEVLNEVFERLDEPTKSLIQSLQKSLNNTESRSDELAMEVN